MRWCPDNLDMPREVIFSTVSSDVVGLRASTAYHSFHASVLAARASTSRFRGGESSASIFYFHLSTMLSRRVTISRIPLVRPLRPPSIVTTVPKPRLFTQNTQLLLVAHRASRPQLPYLSQPAFHPYRHTLLGPNPQLARLLSTETRQYIGQQTFLAAKWTVVLWTFLALFGIAYVGIQMESEERKNPTPDEWRFWTRWYLRAARVELADGARNGVVDWANVGSILREALTWLEDTAKDGKGLVDQVDGEGLLIPEVGRAGYDISAKSWPWRAGYFEVIMGCAVAAEHLEDMVVDKTRKIVFSREHVIGPSNPDPRPVPSYMKAAPLEENCEQAFASPETYYMRVLTTKGFTADQRLDAALGYANWLEYKGLNDSAEEMYNWGIDIAKAGLPTDVDDLMDAQTFVLGAEAATGVTSNLLRATTGMAIHRARTGDVSSALPILLSVLRARRNTPVSSSFQQLPTTPATENAKTDIGQAIQTLSLLQKVLRQPQFPPPPPSGDLAFTRTSVKPTCDDSELMLYIGEILFATSPASDEGLGWTRQAVTVADAILQAGDKKGSDGVDNKAKCRSCLATGVSNWETMLHQVANRQSNTTSREGGRNAGVLEWRGWFGGDGGQKGKTLDEVRDGTMEEELKQVERLKERIAREGIEEQMAKVKNAATGLTWIG